MAERPTPQSIALCTLIALHADPSVALYDATIQNEEDVEQQLSSVIQDWVLGDHGFSSPALDPLLRRVELCAGGPTCLLLLEYIEMSASSIDALIDLIESLRASVAEGVVDGSSSYGIYLRKICLGFDELSFEAVTRLWQALRDAVDRAKTSFPTSNETMRASDNLSGQSAALESTESLWTPSPVQIESSLRKQCLERERGVRESFEDTEAKIQRIFSSNPELPAAHFLRFLNCLQNGERLGALDALHQYFDYAMIKERKEDTCLPQHDVLQYAAILLAAVHSAFGDTSLSLKATEEAVRVAQQSGDAACVAYALGWLFCNTKDDARDVELLRRCSSRAVDSSLQTLSAGANLLLARHYLAASLDGERREGQHGPPAQSWRSLTAASKGRGTSATSMVMDGPTNMSNLASGKVAMEILARQCLVGAGVWDSLGHVTLSGLSSFVALYCYADQMPSQDVAVATQDIARVALYGNGSQTVPITCEGSELNQNLEKLGATKRPAPSCVYEQSLRKLIELKRIHPNPVNNVWANSTGLVLQEWALRRGELGHALSLTCLLHGYLHPRIVNYREITVEILCQHSLLFFRQGQWEKAKSLTKKLCSFCKEWGLRIQHARLLLQLAMIHLDSNPHHFVGALPPLLECLSMCEEFAMDSLHATALSLLAKVHLQLQNIKSAVALLKAALPSILSQAHVWFQGEAYLTLAKCDLYEAKRRNSMPGSRYTMRLLRSATTNLEKSRDLFEKCQDVVRLREVYYLQARVHDVIPGHEGKRNLASHRFRQASSSILKSNAPVWQNVLESMTSIPTLERLASRPLPTV